MMSLPSPISLRRSISNISFKPGVQYINLDLIKQRVYGMDLKESQAVLVFDEMDIKKAIEYDNTLKQVYGPHKKLQVIMARSLVSNWKEIIFFQFDMNMNMNIGTKPYDM